jgi:carbamoyltransferase
MSVILGLNFGHDATVTVLVDGEITAFAQRERLSRIKHAYSLDRNTLDLALSQGGITPGDIDVVAVTSTQGSEPILVNLTGVSMSYDASSAIGPRPILVDYLGGLQKIEEHFSPSMVERVLGSDPDPTTHPAFHHYFAEYSGIPFGQLRRFPWFDAHVELPCWHHPSGLKALASLNIGKLLEDVRCRFGFHYPIRFDIDGISIPGVRVDHHLAHAASSFYRSGTSEALILTNDGYGGHRAPFSNGGVYLGSGRNLIALSPHFLKHGNLYDRVSRFIGLSAIGGSGKLMGLAAYGSTKYFDARFVGNSFDHANAGIDGSSLGWIAYAWQRAIDAGDIGSEFVHADLPFNAFQVNLAASTQKLFEETWLALIQACRVSLKASGHEVENLCLSGGAALNCPSNTRIYRESGFRRVFIEPNCDDGGLSTGAALWTYHALLGNAVLRSSSLEIDGVYGEGYSSARIEGAIAEHKNLRVDRPANPADSAASDLMLGRVIGWFEGGAEVGPRALGHRSVLADPRAREMHYRVNSLKGRELWRPLAPIVLEDAAPQYFDMSGLPEQSPFMLLTAQVLDVRLAAVIHVDGTARLQTVTPANGNIFDVVLQFGERCGIPVLINTSMNGPGEPIVETPEEAIAFLLRGHVDVLYLDGRRICPAQGSSTISPV